MISFLYTPIGTWSSHHVHSLCSPSVIFLESFRLQWITPSTRRACMPLITLDSWKLKSFVAEEMHVHVEGYWRLYISEIGVTVEWCWTGSAYCEEKLIACVISFFSAYFAGILGSQVEQQSSAAFRFILAWPSIIKSRWKAFMHTTDRTRVIVSWRQQSRHLKAEVRFFSRF